MSRVAKKRLSITIGELDDKDELLQQLLVGEQYRLIRGQAVWLLAALGVKSLAAQLSGPHHEMSSDAKDLTDLLPARLVMQLRKSGDAVPLHHPAEVPAPTTTVQGSSAAVSTASNAPALEAVDDLDIAVAPAQPDDRELPDTRQEETVSKAQETASALFAQ